MTCSTDVPTCAQDDTRPVAQTAEAGQTVVSRPDRRPARHRRAAMTKEICERGLAAAAILLLAPALLVIALLIVLDSPGGVLFVQPRYGRGNRRFGALKFRTMDAGRADLSGANQTRRNDPRITRFGMFLRRTSLDELPQLFNVLRGDMALVGPRAHPCGMRVEGRLCEEIDPRYMDRHAVKPGITGWAQVNGSRGAVQTVADLHRRTALDLWYVEHWSLRLDLLILWRTAGVCLRGDLAY